MGWPILYERLLYKTKIFQWINPSVQAGRRILFVLSFFSSQFLFYILNLKIHFKTNFKE